MYLLYMQLPRRCYIIKKSDEKNTRQFFLRIMRLKKKKNYSGFILPRYAYRINIIPYIKKNCIIREYVLDFNGIKKKNFVYKETFIDMIFDIFK